MCDKFNLLKNKVTEKFNANKEFISVFVMSYGVVFVITVCVICLTKDTNWLKLLLDGFVPTTIAFCGTVIIQEYTNSKVHISAIIFVLVLIISLFYIMYIISEEESQYNTRYGLISIATMLLSILLTKLYYPISIKEETQSKQCDGNLDG